LEDGSAKDSTCVGQSEAPICFCKSDVPRLTVSCSSAFNDGSQLSVHARSAFLGIGYPTILNGSNRQVALAVQKELESRCDEGDRLRCQEVERARYEAELARQRYMLVDPGNRLVADSLEAEWNQRLRALAEAQERYEKQKQTEASGLTDRQRTQILALARDFPRLWKDPHTPDRERKRMVRLLIADVTLLKGEHIRAQIRFNGGATHTLHVEPSKPAWMLRKTPAAVVAEMDRLLAMYTDKQVANALNRQGIHSGGGKPFTRLIVRRVRIDYRLKSRYARLRAQRFMKTAEIAKLLHVKACSIKLWRRAGLLVAHQYNDRGQYLFERPGLDAPVKYQHQGKKKMLEKARLQT
jgi:hypothetical protein